MLERLAFLFDRYISRTSTPGEVDELMTLVEDPQNKEMVYLLLDQVVSRTKEEQDLNQGSADAILAAIFSVDEKEKETPVVPMRSRRRVWLTVAAAAIFIILAGSAIWLLNTKKEAPVVASRPSPAVDIKPGSDKAILTLADGRQVILDNVANGAVADQAGTKVIKIGGLLSYKEVNATEVVYNTITVPRKGKYQLILADGSKVWLNAESSLRFPNVFSGNERKVELTGEGYFEVAHNEKQPFIVQRGQAEVKVLGTHFNINGYEDEPSLKVTLLEGRVMVKKKEKLVFLSPGQQALVQPAQDNIRVDYDVDTEEVIAWKNDLFIFNSAPLESIMRQIERWYNVNVVYQGSIPQDRFNGNISRNTNLSEVLKVLEYSNIRFKVEGNTITVLPQ
jgi:ferric-dicitrate binding protein FerR (iron transport regulator)